MRINLGLRGPDIRLGLDNRHLIIEGHIEVIEGDKRSYKVMKCHGRSWWKVMEGLFPSLD